MTTYRHSGVMPIAGVLRGILVGGVAAIGLGALYALAVHYIPIVYVSILATLCCGGGIGWAVGASARSGKIRNTLGVGLLGFVCGTTGLYVAWGTTALALTRFQLGSAAFHPRTIAAIVEFLFENGSWGLNQNGGAVTGIPLAIVWLVEAGIVLVAASKVAIGQIAQLPFCEACAAWTVPEKSVRVLSADGTEPPWSRVLDGQLIALNEFPVATGDESATVHLDLASCPSCEQSHFLTARQVTATADAKGNVKITEKPLATNLIIPPLEAQFVRLCGQEVEPQPVEPATADEEPDSPSPPSA